MERRPITAHFLAEADAKAVREAVWPARFTLRQSFEKIPVETRSPSGSNQQEKGERMH